ncbi:MAG: S-layer homology domain-containing protein [Clostridia bacterium]|nr:S-layer homology domain-containing protein [Clostridia bacterium]
MKRFASLLLACILVCSLAPAAYAAPTEWEVSDEGVEFIKRFEGFSKTPYLDNGTWRIGYGSAIKKEDYPNGITESAATKLFRKDLAVTAGKVNAYLGQYEIELEQCQFDALVSFTYNLGGSWMNPNYKFSSYLIDGLENYDDLTILDGFVVWCHVGKNVDHGIAERRLAEAMLLIYGDYEGDTAPAYTYAVLNGNGGKVDSDIICFEVGESLDRLPVATREDHVLSGWYKSNGKAVKGGETIEEPMELTAKWFLDVNLPFTDVPNGAWYYGYVGELYQDGVVNGMTPTTFEPSGKVNYGQALKLILLATGLEPSDEEMAGHWAQRYEDLAIEAGVVAEGEMGLNDVITRGQIAKIASKAMGLDDASGKSPFCDTDDAYVMALYNAGIVEGTTEKDGKTYFYPDDSITRAEISTIIWRILNHNEDTNSGKIQYASYTLNVLKDVDKYTRNDDNYYDKNGYKHYLGEDTWVGIDVSIHQGNIDWKKVARDGVDYAIIRVGGRGYGDEGIMYGDTNFEKNIEGALEAGLDVGVYYFSQAITVAEAREEAEYVLEQIEDYDITYPVVFDWERIGGSEARTYGLETDLLCKIANTFCSMIEEAGYTPMIYFNSYCGYVKYDLSKINRYDFWFARYNDTPGFYYDFDMWQYSDTGSVSGIKGNVDLNISFKNYAEE